MNSVADDILDEFISFIKVVVEHASNFIEVVDLSEEVNGITDYTKRRIDQFLLENSDNVKLQFEVLSQIINNLEEFFDLKDVIEDTYRANLKTFYRDSAKYLYKNHLSEMRDLFEIFQTEVSDIILSNQAIIKDDFDQQNYKFRNLKLPYTNINEHEIRDVFEAIKVLGYFDLFVEFAGRNDWENAPGYIRSYLEKVLNYDIGGVKCSMLWDVLGYSLIRLEEITNRKLSFKDLFNFESDYLKVYKVFLSNNIINVHSHTVGVMVSGSIDKHTVSSIISIAQVLFERNYLKKEYSLSEVVRIIAQTYNMSASPASLTKKSRYHESMIIEVRRVLNLL